jgi:hypothetical protein
MQLSRVIRRVIALAAAARQEREEWEEKYSLCGRGPDDDGNYVRAIMVPATVVLPKWNPRPAHDALYELLLNQPVAVNYALAVLTAVGRGELNITDFQKMYDEERRLRANVESALRYVAEKVWLAEHLEKSLALCAEARLDIDTLLSFVSLPAEHSSPAVTAACVGCDNPDQPDAAARQPETTQTGFSYSIDTQNANDGIATFSDAVRGAIERARAECDEQRERAHQRRSGGRRPSEETLPAYLVIRSKDACDSRRRPRYARRELNRFLLSLPVTYVYTLAALTRVGRDGLRSATFARQFDAVRRACARPQEALDGMLGKRRLARDLEAALAELANAGIELDSLV